MENELVNKIFDLSIYYLEYLKRNCPNEYSTATNTCLDPEEMVENIAMFFKNRITPWTIKK